MSKARLSSRASRSILVGGRLTSCIASIDVTLALGPSASTIRGTMST